MVSVFIAIYFMTAFLAWLSILVFAILAATEAKEGIECWSREYLWNPFNLVAFHPNDLTEKGRKYRKLSFGAILVFVGMCALGFMLPAVTD